MKTSELIGRAKENALGGKTLDRECIISLLDIDPDSKECDLLGRTAREVASVICGDKAYIWAAIGLDYRTCPMNCRYCSLGEKWGLIQGESEYTEEEIVNLARQFVDEECRWIVLRTTQFYSFNKLLRISKNVRNSVLGEYELGLNVGEFDDDLALKMCEAGIEFVYHTLRLKEGIDTGFLPKDRRATLKAISKSPLNLVSLVEPLGIEHSSEEIADNFLVAMEYGATVTGCMERIPVEGTPLGRYPAISERRLAQVIAVTRLAAGFQAPDICVHRASKLAMEWGANVAVIEMGAIPRDSCSTKSEWKDFNADIAKDWFGTKGYRVYPSIK